MTIEDSPTISTLLGEIKDKSLENILRDVLFSNVSVKKAIKIHRPKTFLDDEIRFPVYQFHD